LPETPFVDLAYVPAEDDDHAGSRIVFPLRVGVELFSDSWMPEAVTRAKQAAILYDEVVFETGLYEVSIAQTGANDWWTPVELLTDEQLARSRTIQRPGTSFQVAVGFQDSGEMHSIIDSPLIVAYASEYHTGILDELALFRPEWVKQVTLGSDPLPRGTPEGDFWRRVERIDKLDDRLMPEGRRGSQRFKRNWVIKAFNRELMVASMIGASFNPTSLFEPMVGHRGASATPDGRLALEIAVPNIGALPWEAVVEFRDHAGSVEARAMLREFERKAASEEPEDAEAFLRSVHRDVVGALFSVLEQQRPAWPEKILAEVIKTAVGWIPGIGQIVGPTLSAAEMGGEWLRERRSWVAAMMVLRRHR